MTPFFEIIREEYGLTARYLGDFESAPNHLTSKGALDLVDIHELSAMKASFEVLIDRYMGSVLENDLKG